VAGSTSTCPKSGLIVGVEREVRRQQCLHVAADAQVLPAAVVERIVRRVGADVARPRDRVGQQLQVLRHARDPDALEMPESRRPADLGLSPVRPLRLLVRPLHVPAHLQPPRLHFLPREAEL
jgi:hypothetical protein